MKSFFKILGLIGLAASSYAGMSSPPAGNYILNVSTLSTKPATNVSSITVRDTLGLGYGTPGNLVYLSTAGVVTTTTTLPTGGDVFKASTQTMTGYNTFVGSTTFNKQVKVQTTGSGQGTGTGGSILVYATDETGMPFQIYTSSANQAGYFGLVNLIASNTNYANAMIYITGTSSSAAKADLYISNPRPNIQLYQTGGASPYGQFEFVVVGDTLQFNAMNAGGSAQKARLGMTHAGALAFYETSDNGRYVALKASATIASNVTWVLPSADGTYGQAILTDGAGKLFFGSVSGSGGSSSMEVMGNGVRITSPTATLSLIAGSNITITTASVAGTTAQITISATGGGSGSGIVSPGTFTWTNTQGITVSTLTATSTTTLQYTTIKGAVPILSTSTLQSGSTVYTSSGTINVFNTNSTSTLKYTEIGNLTHNRKLKIFNTGLPINGGFGPQWVYNRIIADGLDGDGGYLDIIVSTYTKTDYTVGLDSLAGILISPPGTVSGGAFSMCASSSSCLTISESNPTINSLLATNASGVLVSTTVNLGASNVGGILPVANGGTGTATPSITAGTNITSVTGTWPNVTINAATQAGSGGSSSLEVMVDGVRLSSPTATISLIAGSNITLTPSLVGGTTAQITIAATGGGGISLTDLSATQPILYNNATGVFSATPISLSTGAVGTLQAAQMPALTGDITTAGASLATTLASITTANQYGSATVVPVITYDAKGRITAVSSATITGGSGDAVLSATQTFSGANTFSSTVNISSVATITALVLGTTNYAAYGSSGTITPDATMGNNISITLTSSATINVPINAQDFEMFRYRIIQDGAGSRAVTLGSGFAFGTDVSSATFSTAASKVDYLSCIYYSATSKCHIVAPVIRGY